MKILSLSFIDAGKTDACLIHVLAVAEALNASGIQTDILIASHSKNKETLPKNTKVIVKPKWVRHWFFNDLFVRND